MTVTGREIGLRVHIVIFNVCLAHNDDERIKFLWHSLSIDIIDGNSDLRVVFSCD